MEERVCNSKPVHTELLQVKFTPYQYTCCCHGHISEDEHEYDSLTFHPGVALTQGVYGDATRPPRPTVKLGPHHITYGKLHFWKRLLLWAVGLVKKNRSILQFVYEGMLRLVQVFGR